MSSAPAIPIPEAGESYPQSPADFMRLIRSRLANGQIFSARRAVARAAELFSDNAWIEKMNRALNPSRIETEPASAPDRTREFAWLREHGHEYGGQWVALLGDELLAVHTDLEEVLREIRSRNLEAHPLVHHID